MNFQDSLDQLFVTFDDKELTIVTHNIKQTACLLQPLSMQLLTFMEEKAIKHDEFLAQICLPLSHFDLTTKQNKRQLFLSLEKLSALFTSLPTVEAYVFNKQVNIALKQASLDKIKCHNKVLKFNSYSSSTLPNKIQQVQQHLNEINTAGYVDCLYQLQAGHLQIVNQSPSACLIYQQGMILYGELSPLQQLEAQKLFKKRSKKASA